MLLRIKNMVCPRCISAVERILKEEKLTFDSVELGEVTLSDPLTDEKKQHLDIELKKEGFELVNDLKSRTIESIKRIIISRIHHSGETLPDSWSSLLTDEIPHDYKYLSQLFSSIEGITIEQFILRQKIEKVKELISYEDLTIAQIAFRMDYSSAAHLSNQFKKITGMTPSEFKRLSKKPRVSLDKL